MLRVQQATGPPDGWNVMVDGELAWVQEHLRRTGQPVFPPQAVATLRLLPPMHQVLCVARLREASRLDPGQRLHRRILAFQRMYKTGEVPDDSDTEAPPHTGGTDQRATAAERSAASSAAPAEPTPPQRPCPRPPPGPSELEPPRRRPRVEVVAGSPTYLSIHGDCFTCSSCVYVFMCSSCSSCSSCVYVCVHVCASVHGKCDGARPASVQPGPTAHAVLFFICCITHAAEDHRPTIAPYADGVELAHFV
jgi:hypothetical protein